MGQVYRARDLALGRIVALKFTGSASEELESKCGLKKEAAIISRLNHPNICTLYDAGQHAGFDFLVMEFLEGETLDKKLKKGAFSESQAIKLAQQAATGLAHAHRQGVTHGDLKPSNLMLTATGLKILDFGLAEMRHKPGGSESVSHPAIDRTQDQPQKITGTPSYMSPEQIRGQAADQRSDIFSFGVILYEMLAGKKPFVGRSIQELFAAVLTSIPESIAKEHLNPILERIVFRCLEKNPDERFQQASELRFPLDLAATAVDSLKSQSRVFAPGRGWFWAVSSLVSVVLLAIVTYFQMESRSKQTFRFRQVTFRHGSIGRAQFGPGGQTVVYDAAWEGKPSDIYESQLQAPEARALGLPDSYLASVSRTGELYILQMHGAAGTREFRSAGTLARVSLTGGSPRQILENVYAAASSPGGTELAAIQSNGLTLNVQYPLGSTLCKIPFGQEPNFGISTDGQTVAVTRESPGRGYVSLFRKGSQKESVVADGYYVHGLAWLSPCEFAISAYRAGDDDFGLFVVGSNGKLRSLARFPDDFQVQDVWNRQEYLLKLHREESSAIFRQENGAELNLSWLDHTHLNGLSADGSSLLTSEIGQGGGEYGSVYLRKTDGSAATKLCSGTAICLSPDARWALVEPKQGEFAIIPTAAGQSYPISLPAGTSLQFARWFPDGKRVAMTLATEKETGCYVLDLENGIPVRVPRRAGNLSVPCLVVSPDGEHFAWQAEGEAVRLYRLSDGTSVPLSGAAPGEKAIAFSGDGKFLYAASFHDTPVKATVFRIEIGTGRREPRAEIIPADLSGVPKIDNIFTTRDGRQLAYSFHRVLNELFVAEAR